ncbi:MAG: M17 family metallopeptidase [Planctomycetota bacterium]
MTTINFAGNVQGLLRGADALLVIAPKSGFSKARVASALSDDLTKQVVKLAKQVSPGDLGKCASSMTSAKPGMLHVGVLPDKVSRHNCAARAESIRRVVMAAGLDKHSNPRILLILDDRSHYLAAANSVAKAVPLFSMKTGSQSKAKIQILAVDKKGKPIAANRDLKNTVKATREAARLVDSPPTDMNPEAMVRESRKLLRGVANVSITEIRGDALLKAKLGSIHAVGRSAKKAPRLMIAKYRPSGAKGSDVALVGKGITYDTGGLHIKMRGFMEGMKCDMGGAAATLGAFYVLAASGIKRPITLLLCLAENAIGPDAYKPDDIVTMHSGKTVEINNTDAEGRLVLGDGVSYAARVIKADTILDAATLTGAQMVSTGSMHSAIVCNDEGLEKTVVKAGYASGDMAHAMLFAPELYKQEFASPVADMLNSVLNRSNAQSSCAAQFVFWHIEDCKVRWCHVDLAGPAWIKNRGTGYGVALLSETVRSLR